MIREERRRVEVSVTLYYTVDVDDDVTEHDLNDAWPEYECDAECEGYSRVTIDDDYRVDAEGKRQP